MSFASICGTPYRRVDMTGRSGQAGTRPVSVLLCSQDLLDDRKLIADAAISRLRPAAGAPEDTTPQRRMR
jgi:hypothetical protein